MQFYKFKNASIEPALHGVVQGGSFCRGQTLLAVASHREIFFFLSFFVVVFVHVNSEDAQFFPSRHVRGNTCYLQVCEH